MGPAFAVLGLLQYVGKCAHVWKLPEPLSAAAGIDDLRFFEQPVDRGIRVGLVLKGVLQKLRIR